MFLYILNVLYKVQRGYYETKRSRRVNLWIQTFIFAVLDAARPLILTLSTNFAVNVVCSFITFNAKK